MKRSLGDTSSPNQPPPKRHRRENDSDHSLSKSQTTQPNVNSSSSDSDDLYLSFINGGVRYAESEYEKYKGTPCPATGTSGAQSHPGELARNFYLAMMEAKKTYLELKTRDSQNRLQESQLLQARQKIKAETMQKEQELQALRVRGTQIDSVFGLRQPFNLQTLPTDRLSTQPSLALQQFRNTSIALPDGTMITPLSHFSQPASHLSIAKNQGGQPFAIMTNTKPPSGISFMRPMPPPAPRTSMSHTLLPPLPSSSVPSHFADNQQGFFANTTSVESSLNSDTLDAADADTAHSTHPMGDSADMTPRPFE